MEREEFQLADQQHYLTALDVQFAHMIADEDQPALLLAAACLSAATREGHVCLPVTHLLPPLMFGGRAPELAQRLWEQAGSPDIAQWQSVLQSSDAISDGSQPTPLVYRHGRLYLEHMWHDEGQVAAFFSAGRSQTRPEAARVRAVLDALFGPPGAETDWQKVAAAVALSRDVTVISGGPGTGKTTTVARILAALLRLRAIPASRLRIVLAAPTGKAAARLTESLCQAESGLHLTEEEQHHWPREACTLHRLLGFQAGHKTPRHHADNPLHLDVLVVDETSMVDLPMMASLIDALPAHARVIFLGDRDQLASVEAGAVLGDLCQWAEQGYSPQQAAWLHSATGYTVPTARTPGLPLQDGLCLLRHSYRFARQAAIGQLASAVNQGDRRQLLNVLRQPGEEVDWCAEEGPLDQAQWDAIAHGYRDCLEKAAQRQPVQAVLAAFQRYRVLCALREGERGVSGLNRRIEHQLRQQGLIPPVNRQAEGWYPGRPVMITRNDPALGVFNGDIGIALMDEAQRLRVWFPMAGGTLKGISPLRLPPHETAFAITVHKSQGSEFSHCAVVLPDRDTPLLTRELLYTAVTRARHRLSLYAPRDLLLRALERKTTRLSGLTERLWESSTAAMLKTGREAKSD